MSNVSTVILTFIRVGFEDRFRYLIDRTWALHAQMLSLFVFDIRRQIKIESFKERFINKIFTMGHKRPCVLLFVYMCLSAEGRQTRSRNRIVGGDVVLPNSLPYQVSLQVRGVVLHWHWGEHAKYKT